MREMSMMLIVPLVFLFMFLFMIFLFKPPSDKCGCPSIRSDYGSIDVEHTEECRKIKLQLIKIRYGLQ